MRDRHRLSATGLGVVIVLLLAPAFREAWADDLPLMGTGLISYPRGGRERAGAYPEARLPERPATAWIDDLGRDTGAPVVAGDRILVGNRNGDLIALNLTDGAEVWAVNEHGWDVMAAPVVVGDRIYTASNRGLMAHALADGSEVWRHEFPGRASGSSPLVVGDLVIAGGGDGFARALDIRTGEERWNADIVADAPPDPEGFDGAKARIGDDRARPRTASSDGSAVFLPIFDQCRVIALDLKTGKSLWSYQTRGWIGGGTTVGEGKVFVGSQDRKVYALDAKTGKVAWAFETKWRADGDLAYGDGSVFACASDGRCYRLDAKTGGKVWEYETPVGPDKKHFFLSGSPVVDASAVYFGSWDGHLYALNREDGSLKWRYKPHANGEHIGAPITDGKSLFVPLTPIFDFDKQRDKEGVHGIAAIGEARD